MSAVANNGPLFFLDSSALVKLYNTLEKGHVLVQTLVHSDARCFMSELSIPEVVGALISKRNDNLNQGDLSAEVKMNIENTAGETIELWMASLDYGDPDAPKMDELSIKVVGVGPEVNIGEMAQELICKYDRFPDASPSAWSLKDPSDAWILATALYLRDVLGEEVVFVSADSRTHLNDAAREEGLRVIDPNKVPARAIIALLPRPTKKDSGT